ncbi:MAG: LysR family transcriptional regulator [Sneathiellales bacterium]|nr:LysR family transcriptional regulator [Sneathiellales bacterium]
MLDISDIMEVQTICALGSISKAAQELNLSQPTLSKRIARLEDQLGTRLFHRASKGLIPTQAAKYLIGTGENLQAEMQRIERHLKQLSDREQGSISIAVGPIVEQIFLPEFLPEFVDQSGNCRITISTENSEKLLSLIHKAKVDAVIGPFNAEDFKDDFLAFPLARTKTVTVARSDHPIFQKSAPLKREDLLPFPLASPKLERRKTDRNQPYKRKRIICENYPTLKQVVLSTDSVCGGPEVLFREDLKQKRLRIVDIPATYRWDCACIIRPEAIEEPLVSKLVEILLLTSKRLKF